MRTMFMNSCGKMANKYCRITKSKTQDGVYMGKEPAKMNGAGPNIQEPMCSCDNLDLKKNNEFSGSKQIESMKSE